MKQRSPTFRRIVSARRSRSTAILSHTVAVAACLLIGACTGPPLSLSPDTLPDAVVGRAYSADLAAMGGDSPSFRLSGGGLPPGLAISAGSGVISGTPNQSGSFAFEISAATSGFSQQRGSIDLIVDVFDPISLDESPDVARVEEPYTFNPQIAGGLPPYTVGVVGLPAGMSFNSTTGVVAGTPLLPANAIALDFTISDSASPPQAVTRRLTLVVKPRNVAITTESLPAATVNVAYSTTLVAIDGRTPYRWSVINGVLPAGLRLDRNSGVINGTPTSAGAATILIRVQDADSPESSAEREFTLAVNGS